MTADELMRMPPNEAVGDLDWESVEFLFRPSTVFELMLRFDFDGMLKKVGEWEASALPARLPDEPLRTIQRAIDREEFYRRIKKERDAIVAWNTRATTENDDGN